ncbi:MAG: MFS transporter [Thermodesulfobacteriota bacterium]
MKLNSAEKKSTFTIALIISTRLLGIFLILPVFSIYATEYPYANLTLAGIAFGIYALTQSILQIPFGWASDKYGRKKILIFGLLLFSFGSLICAMADNIYELIIARAIQGSGAVGSVAIASLGDLTRPEVRAQAFTISGIVIGIAFVISLVVGPLLAYEIGFNSLFYVLSALGLFGIIITLIFFPKIKTVKDFENSSNLLNIVRNKDIKSLLLAAFILSFCLNLFLFIYPLSWQNLQVPVSKYWIIYLVVLLPSGFFVYPYIKYSEKKGSLKNAIKLAFLFLFLCFITYLLDDRNKFILILTGILFFLGHTIYQSLLPTFLTQRVSSENRGSSSGIYNLANFFGASMGGMLSGFLYSINSFYPLLISLAVLILWVISGLPKQPEKDQIS